MTTQPGPRRRFWSEAAAAVASGLLAVVTVIWPDWIERGFGIEPDQGSGELEWLIVAVVSSRSASASRRGASGVGLVVRKRPDSASPLLEMVEQLPTG
jgi:hypothetical protein